MPTPENPPAAGPGKSRSGYNRLLLLVAGLGGLLYGIDVGIIAGAFPYLKATSGLDAGQLSFVVAAVLAGSAVSTLVAGMLSDWMGRRRMMTLAGILFVVSIPMIALSRGYGPLLTGRLLQGVSGGLVGVVIPLYLAECLGSKSRGKGTGVFQWMLVFGFVIAAIVALYFSYRVDTVARLGDAARLFAVKDSAWRSIFWVSLPPGVLFVIGSFVVAESPRWLFQRGRKDEARRALLRSRDEGQADLELREMEANAAAEVAKSSAGAGGARESLLSRKYVFPFILACVILACNQATGINSIIGYNADIFIQGGLSDVQAHYGNLLFTLVNFLATMVAVMLVDRKGRKFLLTLGTAGIIASLVVVGLLFRRTERLRVDAREAVQASVGASQDAAILFNADAANRLLATAGDAGRALMGRPLTLSVIYSYGGFRSATAIVRSDDAAGTRLVINREGGLPGDSVSAFLSNPFARLDEAKGAPLRIENALITPVPSTRNGWLTAVFTFSFMAFFAIGPGVVVWLALSELMPTRIRSNGMSIALTLNQAVSTTIAAIFLPTVGKYGYSTMFFLFAGFTVIYFVTAAFFLPETKGKTLEEIEQHFERAAKGA
jgi:MFS transporter, SP family, solute carrier family 2 (myo-inositol transporter), member 13